MFGSYHMMLRKLPISLVLLQELQTHAGIANQAVDILYLYLGYMLAQKSSFGVYQIGVEVGWLRAIFTP